MKNFTFNPHKSKQFEFNTINAQSINIKKIEASSSETLREQVFIIETQIGKGIHTERFSFHNSNEEEDDISVINLKNSILKAEKQIDEDYVIYYETLEDKIKRIKAQNNEKTLKVAVKLNSWQLSIEKLYNTIKSTLNPYTDVTIYETELIITEELTGAYKVKSLVVSIFNYNIVFKPFGLFIFGANGRVDISFVGKDFPDSLILVLYKNNLGIDEWKLIKNRNNHNALVFDDSQILKLIDYVIEE